MQISSLPSTLFTRSNTSVKNDQITSNNQRLETACENDQRSKRFQRCALRKFHVTDGQNPHVQITSDRRSKYA